MKTLWLLALAMGGCNEGLPIGAADLGGQSRDGGATQVAGAIGGSAFAAMDAIAVDADAKGADFNGISTVVQLSTFGGACSKQGVNAGVANGRLLGFFLAINDAAGYSSPATATGDYLVSGAPKTPSSKQALGFYQKDGADCLKTVSASATGGKVTVTQTGATIAGTFDLTFGSDHVTGSFSAPRCSSFDPNRTPIATCM
jgi:hypothetical protein